MSQKVHNAVSGKSGGSAASLLPQTLNLLLSLLKSDKRSEDETIDIPLSWEFLVHILGPVGQTIRRPRVRSTGVVEQRRPSPRPSLSLVTLTVGGYSIPAPRPGLPYDFGFSPSGGVRLNRLLALSEKGYCCRYR